MQGFGRMGPLIYPLAGMIICGLAPIVMLVRGDLLEGDNIYYALGFVILFIFSLLIFRLIRKAI